jgi:hypothetical protein
MKTFENLVYEATKVKKSTFQDCNIPIVVNDKQYMAYGVYIAPGDLLFLCKGISATFLIDVYGDKPYALLFDYELENERKINEKRCL